MFSQSCSNESITTRSGFECTLRRRPGHFEASISAEARRHCRTSSRGARWLNPPRCLHLQGLLQDRLQAKTSKQQASKKGAPQRTGHSQEPACKPFEDPAPSYPNRCNISWQKRASATARTTNGGPTSSGSERVHRGARRMMGLVNCATSSHAAERRTSLRPATTNAANAHKQGAQEPWRIPLLDRLCCEALDPRTQRSPKESNTSNNILARSSASAGALSDLSIGPFRPFFQAYNAERRPRRRSTR